MDDKTTKHLVPPTPLFIKYIEGQNWSDEICFTDSFIIGRSDDCDVQIRGGFVSRKHVRISYDGEMWWVKDLESSNGTFFKGRRITKVPLTEDAEFELGKGGPVFKVRLERQLSQKALKKYQFLMKNINPQHR